MLADYWSIQLTSLDEQPFIFLNAGNNKVLPSFILYIIIYLYIYILAIVLNLPYYSIYFKDIQYIYIINR